MTGKQNIFVFYANLHFSVTLDPVVSLKCTLSECVDCGCIWHHLMQYYQYLCKNSDFET